MQHHLNGGYVSVTGHRMRTTDNTVERWPRIPDPEPFSDAELAAHRKFIQRCRAHTRKPKRS